MAAAPVADAQPRRPGWRRVDYSRQPSNDDSAAVGHDREERRHADQPVAASRRPQGGGRAEPGVDDRDRTATWPLGLTEDPITAIENLAPRAFTNHFRDAKIIITPDGFKLTGVVLGEGDLDMKRSYEIIKQNPAVHRLNVELDLKCPLDDMHETLRIERESLERSILFCREELGL